MYFYNLGMFFEHISSKYKSRNGIVYKNKTYTYEQLNYRSNQLITFLRSKNIGLGDLIVISNTKNFDSFALMIACLKIGVIYVNIDSKSPVLRICKILDKCNPKIVFIDQKSNKLIYDLCIQKSIEVHYLNKKLVARKIVIKDNFLSLIRKVDSDSVAYIMFTSGSTGTPKGAAITHQNIIHFINWSKSYFNTNEKDVFANVSPFYFDNSVFDFYSSLFSGASLVPIKENILNSTIKLVNYIDLFKCTVWFSVPSLLRYLMRIRGLTADTFKFLRIIAFGGEGYPKKDLIHLFKLYQKRVKLYNVYGPTECTCICSAYRLTKKDFNELKGIPSIGKINPNFNFIVLDEDDRESKVGTLHLIGPNVGSGYYNDKIITDEVFYNYSGKKHFGKKAYNTGDLVRIIKKKLFFLGRKDNQIKHMGFRIELEEIEFGLLLIKEIVQVAVIFTEKKSGFGEIVAFISTNSNLKKEIIEEKIRQILPSYMVPHKFITLKKLPLNSNGKIDKKKLKSSKTIY